MDNQDKAPKDNKADTTSNLNVSQAQIEGKLKDLWEGRVPLVETFWLYYFAISFVLHLLSRMAPGLGIVFSLLGLVWAGFMIRPIWKAADNYEGEEIWAILAKIAAVLIGLGVLSGLLGSISYY